MIAESMLTYMANGDVKNVLCDNVVIKLCFLQITPTGQELFVVSLDIC